MDENIRPYLGCKQYPFGKQGAGVTRDQREGPGKVLSTELLGSGNGERQLEEGWGTEAVSVRSQHP